MTPSAKIPILPSAPPENVSKIPRIPEDCCSKNCCKANGLIPGMGRNVPRRKIINAPRVKNSLCLNSVAFPKAPKFKLLANLSAAVAIYFFVSLMFPPNFSKTSTAFLEA